MPSDLTDMTEIATALGIMGFKGIDVLKEPPPRTLNCVSMSTWERVSDFGTNNEHAFKAAVEVGSSFLHSRQGLRSRPPFVVEWKGPDRPPGYELVPADLRVDHVYLISCKYSSNVLMNASPHHLFENNLQRRPDRSNADWFAHVSGDEYLNFYEQVRNYLDCNLPPTPSVLSKNQRRLISDSLRGKSLPDELRSYYDEFCMSVSMNSQKLWERSLNTKHSRELVLWRMLRISEAPYFVLGKSKQGKDLSYRVGTPWDWRQRFDLKYLDITARQAGQPVVDWCAGINPKGSRNCVEVRGHVEIRWSHGRFSGNPEAKIYLDTPHSKVPGYFSLLESGEDDGQHSLNTLFDSVETVQQPAERGELDAHGDG